MGIDLGRDGWDSWRRASYGGCTNWTRILEEEKVGEDEECGGERRRERTGRFFALFLSIFLSLLVSIGSHGSEMIFRTHPRYLLVQYAYNHRSVILEIEGTSS